MFGIGAPELILVLFVALIVLGPKKLPEIARGIGRGIREFRKTLNEPVDDEATPEEDLQGALPQEPLPDDPGQRPASGDGE